MSIVEILTTYTFDNPAATISLVDLRRRYREKTGQTIPRTQAVVELTAAR
jgi:hypothetical protein